MRFLPPLAALLLLSACASGGDSLTVPQAAGETPVIPEGAQEAVHTADNGDVIHEYRVAGQLRVIKVVPFRGPTYYIVDSNGDGRIDPRDGGEAPVSWFQLYGW